MKLSQLSLADYNKLDSIPVINQDLSASGFTPVSNTYYRHTGATTNTFTQGVIYLYDTTYHKLGESGGGTTLNKYTVRIEQQASATARTLLHRIIQNAKGNIQIQSSGLPLNFAYWGDKVELHGVRVSSSFLGRGYSINKDGTISYNGHALCKTGEPLTITTGTAAPVLNIDYYNDVEIT